MEKQSINQRRFESRTAIVTGAARGIGRGIAERLADEGRRIACWDVDCSSLETSGDSFAALVQAVDLADARSVEAAFAVTLESFGHVDILVNNAGINGPVVPIQDYPVDAWNRVLAVDLNSVFHTCRLAVPHMRGRGAGRIVNVASIVGKEGHPNICAYAAAKAGVIGLTKSIARELAGTGVTVNGIAPAITETDLFREMTEEHIEASKARILMGRFLTVPEIAAMVAWIASDECSFTTGFTFDLSGGRATY
ncbi:SDR family NAD(P)-dependent oxidoreductase [Paraburkholderia sp. BL25I1N1]|uniref:SDR family NAD(P)-dependent oxidoreductase n=1 Tax=Paraburkholderia sp. BL25I1N1 TaxID=1938804 RepID=UPI000D057256|nr:SDR family NAD(P)-dependent oxidoreductase [Paraburkholderia sp. BL25I1N1]PRY04335.1 3-oxoacyl-[acyl-carrier protein] reductase [Paraburkholderia sp. BL25I1N1]